MYINIYTRYSIHIHRWTHVCILWEFKQQERYNKRDTHFFLPGGCPPSFAGVHWFFPMALYRFLRGFSSMCRWFSSISWWFSSLGLLRVGLGDAVGVLLWRCCGLLIGLGGAEVFNWKSCWWQIWHWSKSSWNSSNIRAIRLDLIWN